MKTDWNNVLTRLEWWYGLDHKSQEACDAFMKVIACSSRLPVLNLSHASAYIDGLAGTHKGLKGWLEYYLYEVLMHKTSNPTDNYTVTDENGKEYDFKSKNDVVRFLQDNFS